jgi:hypothetical protein
MHPAALQWVKDCVAAFPDLGGRVLEFGARYINGGVRDVIPHEHWCGVDIVDGSDVDVVANAATLVVRAVRDGAPPHVVNRRLDDVAALVERWRVLERDTRLAEGDAPDVPPRGGPGWPGPCPDGMPWERWLAANNVD